MSKMTKAQAIAQLNHYRECSEKRICFVEAMTAYRIAVTTNNVELLAVLASTRLNDCDYLNILDYIEEHLSINATVAEKQQYCDTVIVDFIANDSRFLA